MPSSFINTDNIGNCYLNRVDGAVLQGELIGLPSANTFSGDAWREFFTVKWGDDRTKWTPSAATGSMSFVGIRFPVSWETLTGNIATPSSSNLPANARVNFEPARTSHAQNTSNTGSVVQLGGTGFNMSPNNLAFAVINDYAMAWCYFSDINRTNCSFGYLGWLRDDSGGSGGRYTGAQFPRNLCSIGITNAHTSWAASTTNILRRVSTENLTTAQNLYSTNDTTWNPAINCIGDSTPLILRDSVSPFNRVGMTYHLFRIPSSCVIGQIYKLGTDPDGSNKPYVICCGTWGTNFKVGMRIWADGYT